MDVSRIGKKAQSYTGASPSSEYFDLLHAPPVMDMNS